MNWIKPHRRCDGVLRRDALRVGGLTAFGLSLNGWFDLRASAGEREAKAESVILIWLDGGPSHLETFDPKPDAPAEVRGPLETIATKVPGVHIRECLPNTAAMMDKVSIIRSMTSPLGEHNFGTHYLMTGYKPTPALEYPAYGSVVSHLRYEEQVLPAHIAVPTFRVGGSDFRGNGYLPSDSAPFSVGGDPAKPGFKVRDLDLHRGIDLDRLQRRKEFVDALDGFARLADLSGDSSQSDLEDAYRLVASANAKQAFDLTQETASLRQRYGTRTVGQSCLMARRLVERGVPFVTVTNTGWDTHESLFTRLHEGYTGAQTPVGLVPNLDRAVSALIEDLKSRGMLDETLVVVMGEFGRTPKLNTRGGRDHWPRVFSVMLAGGGASAGLCLGSSDAVGESPVDQPVTPADLAATIYALLGFDPSRELRTEDGRPIRLAPASAQVVQQIIA